MYNLQEIVGSEITKWNKFILTLPGGTIFHTLKWLRLIEDHQPLRAKKLGIFLDSNLIGIFPLFLKRFLFIKVAGSPFLVENTPYMGPVIDPCHILNILPPLDEYLKENGIRFLRTISNQAYHVGKGDQSYNFIEKHTHILDITRSQDSLWKNLEGRCRTAIRKAEKSKVTPIQAGDRHFIEEYYSMIEEVYHAQGMRCPNSKDFYYDMWDKFAPDNAMFLSARFQGHTIAGIIVMVDGRRAYYLNGASKHKFRSLSATNLLLWEAINIARKNGVEEFDFVGSDIPRLAKFKKSFGGQLVEYSLIEKASSPRIYRLRNRYPYYKQKVGNLSVVLNRVPLLGRFLP